MIRHVAMFRWNDEVPDTHAVAVGAALDALPGVVESIVRYSHGRDLELSPTAYDYAVVADFADADGWATYRDHPDHQAFIAEFITDHVADRVNVQFELG